MIFLKSIFLVFEILILLSCLYILIPALLYPFLANRISRFRSSEYLPSAMHDVFFTILIPAHNEASVIPKLLKSLQEQDYPKNKFRVIGIADNCSDQTATLVRQSGFEVFERFTDYPSDKPQALAYGGSQLGVSKTNSKQRVIVIVDADSFLVNNYLTELNKCYQQKNAAEVFQTFRSVSNIKGSDVAALDGAAEALRQSVFMGVRKCFGLESHLHGSGTSFTESVFAFLINQKQEAFADDKAWKAHTFARQIKVDWAPSAHLKYTAVEQNQEFQQQRKRWIGGQFEMIKKYGWIMLWQGIKRLNLSQIDFAFAIFQLPRSFLMLLCLGLGGLSLLFPAVSPIPFWIWWGFLTLFIGYAMLGFYLIGIPIQLTKIINPAMNMISGVFKTTVNQIFFKNKIQWDNLRNKNKQ